MVRAVRIAPAGTSAAAEGVQGPVNQGGCVVPLKSRTDYQARAFSGATDPTIRVDPSPATSDKNVVRGMPPKNPHDDEIGMRKGGKVTRVSGSKRGKEDGTIAVQKGEFVVRKAAVQKHGPAKMAAVNKGTARITVPKKGKR